MDYDPADPLVLTIFSGFSPSLSAWIPLLYDTVVIFLTLVKCVGPVKQKTASHIVRTLLRDGLLYYRLAATTSTRKNITELSRSVIFSVNFVLAIMIVTTPVSIVPRSASGFRLTTIGKDGVKNIAAQ